MKLHRAISVTLLASVLAVCGLYQPRAHATAFSTDFSDLWWIPSESGWGIQFVQQHNIIFATMFVYGPGGQPTWYVATMPAAAPGTFTGALYVTQGPYFGTTPFNPASVTNRQVGAMSVNFPTVGSGTLTYSVDGTNVTKHIVRETFANQNFNGSFTGGIIGIYVSGDCHLYTLGRGIAFGVAIAHNREAAIAMNFTTTDDTCSMPAGTYSQTGHVGRIRGNFTCQSGDAGSIDVFEGNINYESITARYSFQSSNTACHYEGDFAGVRQ